MPHSASPEAAQRGRARSHLKARIGWIQRGAGARSWRLRAHDPEWSETLAFAREPGDLAIDRSAERIGKARSRSR
jgi:hypothetical protein